ncbi:MAG TPA: hypothetical protein VHM72_00255 [Solirubrobacteraceae bacterium]|nr:hypothetical protein [Solirubrobacteraceae bacterium]
MVVMPRRLVASTWPPSQHTGSCAHVLVMRYGGGTIAVYAARIAP